MTDQQLPPGVTPTGFKVIKAIETKGAHGWQDLYQDNTVPWDQGKQTPALEDLLKSESLPDGIAMVPGCGYGHDVVLLASEKRHVIGLDIAPLAVERAQKVIEGHSNTEVVCADFFTFDMDGKIDLMFDYTFFCALPPPLREPWADKMAKLIKPGGIMIAMMFPLDVHEGGPPFTVSLDLYKNLLEPRGFELVRVDENIRSWGKRAGNEKLALWKRK